MKIKLRYILILFADLILSSVIIDYAILGDSEPDNGFRKTQDHSFSKHVIDLPSITEDFSSVTAPQIKTGCSTSESPVFHYSMSVLTINGRSPPFHFYSQATSWSVVI